MIVQRLGVDERRRRRAAITTGMLAFAFCAGALAFLLFMLVPELDMSAARLFYSNGHFAGRQMELVSFTRASFNVLFYLTCIVAAAGVIVTVRTAHDWLGLGASKWLFLVVCLIAGPLVVANIGLKDHWGRARPRDVIEFGGAKAFTPPFPPANQCQYNCSFVSGEASSIYIVFFAAAFLFRSRARSLALVGVIAGSLAGLTRMAEGAHFLSDVVFAGVAMALTAAGVQVLFDIIKSATHAELAASMEIQRRRGNDRVGPVELNPA